MEIISSALLVLAVFFYFEFKSKIKKLEKRVEDLESKLHRSSLESKSVKR
ncbi:hypothetical protein N0O92_11255 [Alkalihalobacillus sp. MEB130]|nr:hypothetical protein [Alkalihalobacillus sp. MEB130]MDT8860812.1 hypothetical protein [Alkalihalobacillus sp. MEB130]